MAAVLIPSPRTLPALQQESFGLRKNCSFTHLVKTTSSANELKELRFNFITADELDKRLSQEFSISSSSSNSISSRCCENNSLLIIDLRSVFQYQESHIRESTNLTNCALLSKRIQSGKLKVKEYLAARVKFDGSQDVVIYEQGGWGTYPEGMQDWESLEERNLSDFAKLIYKNMVEAKTKTATIQILRGGFDLFRQNYPKHCTQGVQISTNIPLATNLNDDQMAFLNWEASKIQEKIYLGALHDAQNDRLLKRLGITHILNCCKTSSRNCEDSKNGRYEYLQLCYDDNLKQSLDEKLEIAVNFIDSAMQQEGAKVLIHCYAGISRSAAITIAYLMHSNSMSYEQAYREVKLKRSIVAPNINFVAQLMKYDEEKRLLRQL